MVIIFVAAFFETGRMADLKEECQPYNEYKISEVPAKCYEVFKGEDDDGVLFIPIIMTN